MQCGLHRRCMKYNAITSANKGCEMTGPERVLHRIIKKISATHGCEWCFLMLWPYVQTIASFQARFELTKGVAEVTECSRGGRVEQLRLPGWLPGTKSFQTATHALLELYLYWHLLENLPPKRNDTKVLPPEYLVPLPLLGTVTHTCCNLQLQLPCTTVGACHAPSRLCVILSTDADL
jgi:hypothetical protein